MKQTETAIIKTLAYYDIFDYPLTSAQLWKNYCGKPISYSKFSKTLTALLIRKIIFYENGYYTFYKRRPLVELRQKREKISQTKLKRADFFAQLLAWIPCVWFVGVSGSLALKSAQKEDDIDFFVITAPHLLWLTRLFSTVFLDILGVRRKPLYKKAPDRICLNMFMDRASLILPKTEQDLYSAHEIIQLRPLVNKHGTYESFLSSNNWIQQFLPHATILDPIRAKPLFHIFSPFLQMFEPYARDFQLKYMAKKRTTELISAHELQFHPEDARGWVLKEYKKRLRKWNISILI